MDTIRSPLLGAPSSGGGKAPAGVRSLHAAPRHGLLRSWGLLLVAIVIGLTIALLGYDRPTSVGIGDPAAATGPASSVDGQTPGQTNGGDGGAAGNPAADTSASGAAAAGSAGAVVHVVGEVGQPGVLTMPIGARVADAVAAAGGALPGADLSGLNLARRVNDGEQIVVAGPAPSSSTTEPGVPSGAAGAVGPGTAGSTASAPGGGGASSGLVNLNRATSADLQELPRVGPVTAEKILAFREQNGPFTAVDQLLEVPGIGEGTLAGLRDLVTV